jgi:transposase
MDVTHTLDDADKTCPSCGGELTEWEGQAEESEEIDVVERQFVIRKHRRLKYRCKCHACVETAIGPAKLIAGGRYSPAFAVEVACQKYCDHLPLERQARIMEREGLTVTSQTLWDQLDALAAHLQPIHERIRDNVLASPVLHADETRWRLLNGRGEDGGDAPWHVWAIATPSAISYRILDGRSKLQAGRILGNYRGTIVADGYGVYQSLSRDGPGFRLAGCWAHARRKYVEAAENYPQPSNAMLELIGQLYDVERDAADAAEQGTRDLAEIRAELRTQRSRTLIDAIFALAEKTYSAVLPKSAIGKATAYLLNQRKPLCVFLDDGRVPIDNNAVERGLRGPVIGRKNHYGSKSRRGMEVAALFYSLIETCKLAGVEPKAYLLRAVTAALANEPAPLPGEASPAN